MFQTTLPVPSLLARELVKDHSAQDQAARRDLRRRGGNPINQRGPSQGRAQPYQFLAGYLDVDAAERAPEHIERFELVVHDVETPYFRTQMLLDQIPDYGPSGRLQLKVYSGGHMHYSRDKSRKALREDTRQLIEGSDSAVTTPNAE